jgi:MsuE subfamily FMN reductase
MELLGLSGSPTTRSKTRIAVEEAVAHAQATWPELSAEVIHIRDHDVEFCDGRDPSLYEGDTRMIIDRIVAADALIVGTPMYRGSYSGVLKNVFDVIPNDALHGKPVGLIATGGSDHHYLAIEHELKPVIGFFSGHAIPGAVYANNQHYSNGDLVDEGILDRLGRLAEAVVRFAQEVPRDLVGAAPPAITRQSLAQS